MAPCSSPLTTTNRARRVCFNIFARLGERVRFRSCSPTSQALARSNGERVPAAASRDVESQCGAAPQNARRTGARVTMSTPARVLLVGANGRMGRTVAAMAEQDPGLTIVARADQGDPLEPLMS